MEIASSINLLLKLVLFHSYLIDKFDLADENVQKWEADFGYSSLPSYALTRRIKLQYKRNIKYL